MGRQGQSRAIQEIRAGYVDLISEGERNQGAADAEGARVQQWGAIRGGTAQLGAATQYEHHYYAFLSYSHRDEANAEWLHEALENFRVPSTIAGRLTQNGVIPKRRTMLTDLDEWRLVNQQQDLGIA